MKFSDSNRLICSRFFEISVFDFLLEILLLSQNLCKLLVCVNLLNIFDVCLFEYSEARCSIVGYNGEILADVYSKPDEPVTNYRTRWSGTRPTDLTDAIGFEEARACVKIIKVSSDRWIDVSFVLIFHMYLRDAFHMISGFDCKLCFDVVNCSRFRHIKYGIFGI